MKNDAKETSMRKLFYKIENIYRYLTWEATERKWNRAVAQQDAAAKAEQRTEHQAVQRAVQLAVRRPSQLRNSNELRNELLI